MASVLQVATIKDQGGNANAIEIANSSANVTINNLAGGAIGSAVTMSSNQACVKTALNASGNPGIYAVRAWVNVAGSGTINADAGFSSVGVSGQLYTFNFSTNMPDANYSVSAIAQRVSSDASSNCFVPIEKGTAMSTSSFNVWVFDTGNNTVTPNKICITVVR